MFIVKLLINISNHNNIDKALTFCEFYSEKVIFKFFSYKNFVNHSNLYDSIIFFLNKLSYSITLEL